MIKLMFVLTLITHIHGMNLQALSNITASDPVQDLGQHLQSCCTALGFTPLAEKLISLLWQIVHIFSFNVADRVLFNL